MTKPKSKSKKQSKRAAYVALLIILGTLVLLAGIGSGVLQYGFAAATCLKAPVAASRFMAGYTYDLPGDSGYGPGVFNEYYCSEQEAIKAGFRRI